MAKNEQNVFTDVLKRIRRKHGDRGMSVLKAFVVVLFLFAALGFFAVQEQWGQSWGTWMFGTAVALLILSPFVVVFFLEAFAFVFPKHHAAWKSGRKIADVTLLPAYREKHDVRRHLARANPYDFERIVGNLYESYGYKVEYTQKSGDYGIDLLLKGKDEVKHAVQVKRFTQGPVGRPSLQMLQGAMLQAGAEHAIFVTLSSFSEPARQYAREWGMELVDGEDLIRMYLAKGMKSEQPPPPIQSPPEPSPPLAIVPEAPVPTRQICNPGPYTVQTGKHVSIPLNVEEGDHILGRIEEADGEEFDWWIVDEEGLVDFKNSGEVQDYSDGEESVRASLVDHEVEENGPWFLLLLNTAEGERTIEVHLRLT